jgi:hypothetical protein
MPLFADDDAGYLEWVRQHPRGYVLVSWNPPTRGYVTVHRADCYTINPELAPHVENWTHHYVKACGESLGEIERWADAEFGAGRPALYVCGHCRRAGRL